MVVVVVVVGHSNGLRPTGSSGADAYLTDVLDDLFPVALIKVVWMDVLQVVGTWRDESGLLLQITDYCT